MTTFLDELLAYGELDDDERKRLVGLHAVLSPHFATIAEHLCARAKAHPGMAPLLADGSNVESFRMMLIEWMSTGLLGPYDDAFDEQRMMLGRRYVEIGGAQYFILTAMNAVRRAYGEKIVVAYPAAEAPALTRAVDKLLEVELAVMLRHYQRDSEAKLLESERHRRGERAEALQTMCSGLAHEIRNPLNSAQLQLELLERRLKRDTEDPKLTEPLELAHHEIARLATLLREFLAFARPPPLDTHEQDVISVVRDVIDHERPKAEKRGAELIFDGAAEPVFAEIDAAKIRNVVENLVSNGIEAATAGGNVSVAVVPSDDHIHIRVTDTGAGIPAAVLPRIYEPFFSTKEGGTGMGMSIAHSLVTLHRGTIEVASSPSGTTFDVVVPRRREA